MKFYMKHFFPGVYVCLYVYEIIITGTTRELMGFRRELSQARSEYVQRSISSNANHPETEPLG